MESTTLAFDRYYAKIYGSRWLRLKAALLDPAPKISRSCFDGYAHYHLDEASILAAEALQVQKGDHVLDLCAAPGGKMLILAEKIGEKGTLIANELSRARRLRLQEVIETHVPTPIRARIKISGFDGNLFGLRKKGVFDRILLDAPCSSEQHLLEKDLEQKDWKESRTKNLAMRQYSLLCSALLALKPGGTLVYATCSISTLENDGVIARLLRKKQEEVQLDEEVDDLSKLEKTEFGFQVFPDLNRGTGPIFFSRLKKRI